MLQENAPAPQRAGRKRGAPAQGLDTVAMEEQVQEEAQPDADGNKDAEAAPVAKAGKGKPPLPSKARRGRTTKKEPNAGE